MNYFSEGLEICEQVSNADAVVIPVGGGGLIAGVATAIKAMSSTTKIIVCDLINFYIIIDLIVLHYMKCRVY